MDLELLRAFVAVAECGGFSPAARSLNRTQSAVSLQIKRLEERLGAQLFERSSRRVALSEAGGGFLPYARRMLRLQEEAREAIGRSGQKEVLRLGLPDEQAMAYLADLLGPFAQEHPEVQLASHDALSEEERALAIEVDTARPLDLAAIAGRWLAAAPFLARPPGNQ